MSTPPDEPAVPPDEPRPDPGEPAAEPAGPQPPEVAGPGVPGSGAVGAEPVGSEPAGREAAGPGSGSPSPGSGSADETTPLPRAGDETTVLPSAGPTQPVGPPQSAGPPRWTARAGIPPAADVPPDGYEDDGGPGWWRPAVLGLVALILLGMLLTGVWLITKAREERPGPVPTRSAPSTTQPPTSRPAPTRTGGPSPSPAALVEVPPVVGVDVLIAQDLLDQAGLTYRVLGRLSDRRPGTVVASTPEPGTRVPPRSSVTLFVAVPPPTTAPATTPAVPTAPAGR